MTTKHSELFTITFFYLLFAFPLQGFANEKSTPLIQFDRPYQFIDDADLPAFIDHDRSVSTDSILDIKNWNYNPAHFTYPTDLESNIWFKFRLNRHQNNKGCVLQLYNGLIPLLKVYKKEDNKLILIDSLGSLHTQTSRSNAYRDAVIELPYEENDTEYYFMVYAKYYHGFDIAIRRYDNLFNYALKEYYLLGAYYGILLLVLVYNLFYFFQVKDKLYILYAFYVFVAIVSSASTDLTGYWNLWPQLPELTKPLIDQTKWILSLSFVLYALHFLQLRQQSLIWHRLVQFSAAIYVLYNALVINLILPTNIVLFIFVLSTHLIVLWWATWLSWKREKRASGIFLVGLSAITLAFICTYLRYWEIIPANVPTNFIMHYGILAEVVVLTYAMSFKFKEERLSKLLALELKAKSDEELIAQLRRNDELQLKVKQELEEKVAHKTKDLHHANLKLQEQAQNIQAMNEQLAKLNGTLYLDKKKQQQARALSKNMTKEEFFEIFPSKIECYHLIKELKQAKGYSCKKCKNTSSTPGTGLLAQRCTKCGYNESITASTIFKGFRSAMPNGFYLLYLLVESDFKITSTELAKRSDLSVKTAWNLHTSITEAFKEHHSKQWMDFILT